MTRKVVKSTSRGQITLPKNWRGKFDTESFVVELHDTKLIITPLYFSESEDEEVLFDADRDNNGRGVSPDDIIAALREIDG